MNNRADHITQFLDTHLGSYEMHPLAGDASFRRYIRVKKPDGSFMLMDAPPEKETIRPFMAICKQLVNAGFSAPNMIASDEKQGFLLLEDLGDDTFSRLLREGNAHEEEYYAAAIDVLAAWHTGGMPTRGLEDYDHTILMREVQLLSNWFLPQFLDGLELEEAQASYVSLWNAFFTRAPLSTNQFVHRDYHADNLIWLPDRKGIARVGQLDFQDALAGDAAYDMVSLLEDARRDVPPMLVHKMLARYLAATGAEPERFSYAYALLAAQRNSKIVGIFTRLAARDGKKHYLDYLPRVWEHLINDAAHPELKLLRTWLDTYVPKDKRGVIAIRKDAAALGLVA